MSIIGEILFFRSDHASVSDVVRHMTEQAQSRVDGYAQSKFDTQSDDDVIAALVEDLGVAPIAVNFEDGQKSVDEITLTVADHWGERVNVPGYCVTKSFPFTGDESLWKFGTGTWGSSMPYGKVGRGKITIGMEVRQSDTETAVRHITTTVDEIKRYVEQQRQLLVDYNAALPGRLRPLVEARRGRRNAARDLLDRF